MIWAILFLATILRLINLNQSLWLDEASQVLMSQKSLQDIIFERSGDFHPPLSYIFYHFWMMLGTSEIWLRFLPVIFGVGTIFVVYKFTERLLSKKIATVSALLLATAPYHVYYSEEIRMYSLTAFFASLSMYFLVTNKKVSWIISTSALLYTHYMGIFLLVAQVLYKKNFKLLGLVFLSYIPWLPFLFGQLVNGVNANQYLPGWSSLLSLNPIKAIPLTFIKFSIGRINFEPLILYGAISTIVLIFLGYLIFKAVKLSNTKLLSLWLFIPIALTWVISFILPLDQPFRLLFVLPVFYILLAVGILELGRFWRYGLLGVLVISFLGLLIYWTNPKFQREDWRGTTKVIPENAVFAWPVPFDPYIWYGGKGIGVVKHFPASENEVAQNLVNAKLSDQVYVFEYLQTLSDPNHYIQKWLLENGYTYQKTLNYNGVGLVYKFTLEKTD